MATLGYMSSRPVLSLPEWTVLAIVSQRPAHGFAIAQLTERGGELGRVWHMPRPVIYRAIGRLVDAGLLTQEAVEAGRGPQRTIYTVTPEGRRAAAGWLDAPVQHIREIRSQLMLKLALRDRAGCDPTDLLKRQRAVLEPIARAMEDEEERLNGFDAVLFAWRRATAVAALGFLDDITQRTSARR